MSLGSLNVKRPTKKQAFEIVQQLGELADNPDMIQKLGELYQYFIPPIPAKPKTPEQWVAKAIAGPKDVRSNLGFIRVKNGVMVATDGLRLHTAPTGLRDGSYDKALTLIDTTTAGVFPLQWGRLTRVNGYGGVKLNTLNLEVKSINGILRYLITHAINNEKVAIVDKKYMDDALSYLKYPTLYYKSPTDRLVLMEGDNVAVISPFL